MVCLGPSIRMCNLIFILCASGFLVSPEEQAYYITLDKIGLLISKSFLPAFTNSCSTTVLLALLLSSLLVGAKREIFWPSICSQNHAPIYFLGPSTKPFFYATVSLTIPFCAAFQQYSHCRISPDSHFWYLSV